MPIEALGLNYESSSVLLPQDSYSEPENSVKPGTLERTSLVPTVAPVAPRSESRKTNLIPMVLRY
jgi:hypothetical protein